MTDKQQKGLGTRCIHAGDRMDAEGAIFTPLYNHTTFGFRSTQDVLDVLDGKKSGNLYTRYGMNPTIRAVERKLADLEGAAAALVFGAGMAAESCVFLALCRPGDEVVVVGDIYGGSYELLATDLAAFDIRTRFLLGSEVAQLQDAISGKTRLVYFETPTNPTMEVFDIAAIAALARKANALTVVDNTFASPINQQPLALGADLVVESATKFMGGHSDLTGGVVAGASNLLDKIAHWRKNLGQIMAPDVAYLLTRSLRTLKVRVEQQNRNAQAIAEFLSAHPKVKQVNYPGLAGSKGHAIAQQQMRGFGGMISFVYDGNLQQTAAVADRLELFTLAPSLGGVESLITQPVTTTHHGMEPAERKKRGIDDGLLRLAIGIEDADDLIADLRAHL